MAERLIVNFKGVWTRNNVIIGLLKCSLLLLLTTHIGVCKGQIDITHPLNSFPYICYAGILCNGWTIFSPPCSTRLTCLVDALHNCTVSFYGSWSAGPLACYLLDMKEHSGGNHHTRQNRGYTDRTRWYSRNRMGTTGVSELPGLVIGPLLTLAGRVRQSTWAKKK